jgi:2-keto-4-pentenoate hydratase
MSFPTTSLGDDPRVARGLTAQLESRARRLRAGDRPLGWKLGFGSAAARSELGIAAPLVGHLTRSACLEPGATVRLAGWSNPILEPEVAIRLGAGLGPGADRRDVAAAIGRVAAAFELVDVAPPPTDVERILAGNVFHRHVVLGPGRSDVELAQLTGRVSGGAGTLAVIDDPWAATGEPIALIAHVADLLARFGLRLEADDVIICGSIVAPIEVAPSDRIGYVLDPIGEIAVSFDA